MRRSISLMIVGLLCTLSAAAQVGPPGQSPQQLRPGKQSRKPAKQPALRGEQKLRWIFKQLRLDEKQMQQAEALIAVYHDEMDELKENAVAVLERIKDKMAVLEGPLIERLLNAEIDNITLKGGRKVFIYERVWAKITGERVDAVKALKDADMEDFVAENFNSNSVSAFVAECIKNNTPLPESFNGIIEANPKQQLRVSG